MKLRGRSFKGEAQLTKVKVEPSSRSFILESSGEAVELGLKSAPETIFSVTDRNGVIVRTAHSWLSKLSKQIGMGYSAGTVDQYGKGLSYLVRWIEQDPPLDSLSIDENICLLNRDDVLNWLEFMKNNGVGPNTLHSREACLYELLDWLCTQEGGARRDSENSPKGRDGNLGYIAKRPSPNSPKYITTEHIIQLLSAMHNECERSMFHTQYDTGVRITELVELRNKELPKENQYNSAYEFIPICIAGVKGRSGNKKERNTLISRATLRRISAYHNSIEYRMAPGWTMSDPDKPVFLTTNQLKWNPRNATKQFRSAVIRSGLPHAFRSHWLRHGTAFSVLQSDVGKDYLDRMLVVQQMLGHSDLSTTEIYTQISPQMLDRLTKAGKRLDRLEEAEEIRKKTYLAFLEHKEKRGHHGGNRSTH